MIVSDENSVTFGSQTEAALEKLALERDRAKAGKQGAKADASLKPFSLRLSIREQLRLRAEAAVRNTSASELARDLINKGLQAKPSSQPDESIRLLQEVLARLERLELQNRGGASGETGLGPTPAADFSAYLRARLNAEPPVSDRISRGPRGTGGEQC